MSCCGKRTCVRLISKLCWELGIAVQAAGKIDGNVYAFVLTEKDGTKIPFRFGKDLERFLLERTKKAKSSS